MELGSQQAFFSPNIAKLAGLKVTAAKAPPKKLELPPDPVTFQFRFLESESELKDFYVKVRREQGTYQHEEMHQSVITAERYFPDNSETQALKKSLEPLTNRLIETETFKAAQNGSPVERLKITPLWLLIYLEYKYKLYYAIPEANKGNHAFLRAVPSWIPKINNKERPFKVFQAKLKSVIYFCLTNHHFNNLADLHRRIYFSTFEKEFLDVVFDHLPLVFREQFTDYLLRESLGCNRVQNYRECYSFATFLSFLDDPIESKTLETIYRTLDNLSE